VKHEGWTSAGPTSSQPALLARFEGLLREHAIPRGMVAVSDVSHLGARHLSDSLRAASVIGREARRACDLGSGAGLPGIPVAIVRPDLEVTLAESRRNRVAFLELVLDGLRLPNVVVFPGRVDDLVGEFDVCLARGFANPARSWASAQGLLAPRGRLLYWAGRTFRPEDAPEGVRVQVGSEATLESGGPIVIMTRQ
jgi:16S rRNA (guanine527-N7)-methyltransferase